MILKPFKPSMAELAPFIEQAVSEGRDVRLTVTGYSMYPLLRSGTDDVILSPAGKIRKYDVVLFKRDNGSYVFHRVIKIKNNVLTLAGDNETVKEYPVSRESVIAVMKSFVRSGKIYETNELWYILYSKIWLLIFPLRPVAAKMFYTLARVYRKLKGVSGHKKAE